jgi:hypothetical protein
MALKNILLLIGVTLTLCSLVSAQSSTAGASSGATSAANSGGTTATQSYWDELLALRDKIDIGWGVIAGIIILILVILAIYFYRKYQASQKAALQRTDAMAVSNVQDIDGTGMDQTDANQYSLEQTGTTASGNDLEMGQSDGLPSIAMPAGAMTALTSVVSGLVPNATVASALPVGPASANAAAVVQSPPKSARQTRTPSNPRRPTSSAVPARGRVASPSPSRGRSASAKPPSNRS